MKSKYKNSVRDILIDFFSKEGWTEDGRKFIADQLKEKVEEQWPKKFDIYYFIDDRGKVQKCLWGNYVSEKDFKYDQYRLKTNNVFKTKSEAEARLKEVMEGK
jgi:hypothetical protein